MKKMKMKIILSIKAIAFISIVFMFSSCMMMSPNHLSGHSNNDSNHSSMQLDLVCGQSFETIQDVSFVYQYDGLTYYFHSEKCKNDFIQAPESYINNQSDHHKGRRNNGMMWGLGAVGMVAMMVIMFF